MSIQKQLKRNGYAVVAAICVMLAGIMPVKAQTAVDGAIGGTVEDSGGAVVVGATVTVVNKATNASQTVKTNSAGDYRLIHLEPGHYTVSISAPGFGTFSSPDLIVEIGSLTTLQPKLNVGGAAEQVVVSDVTPVINLTSPEFTQVITHIELTELPVNNYRYTAFALQTPGVVEGGGFGLLSFRGQSTLLNEVAVDGANNNQFFFSEERGRTTVGYSLPRSVIQEFQVLTQNYGTEYGRAAGGVINTITRSGSNTFHGEGYFIDRDSAFAAQNDFTTESVQQTLGGPFTPVHFKPTDIRKQQGFAVGGPILKDKLFFYFALDDFFHYFPIVLVPSAPATYFTVPNSALPAGLACPGTGVAKPITAANDPNFNGDSEACTLQTNLNIPTYSAAASAYNSGFASLNSLLGEAPRFASQTVFFPKIDWQINAKNHASFEGTRLRFISPGGQQTNATASYGLESVGNIYVRTTYGIAKLDTFITNNLSNEVRYQYGRDFNIGHNETPTAYENTTLDNPPGYTNPNQIPPNVNITNAFQFGTATFYNRPAYPDERTWEATDTMTLQHGKHSFKYGFDYIHTNDLSENLTSFFGAYSYTNITNYLTDYYISQKSPVAAAATATATHYSSYAQGFGPLGFEFQTGDWSGFVQDEWKPTPRLTLTAGLRYEFEQLPKPQLPNANIQQTTVFPSDKNNIAPRVGFALDAFGTGKTVVRGGYGIFNARLINSTIYNAIAQTGSPLGQSTPSVGPTTGGPAFPLLLTGGNAPLPTVYYFDNHFQLPQIHQFDLAVQQDLGWNTVLSVSYLGALGRELPIFTDTNLPAPINVNYTVVNNGISDPIPNGTVVTVPFYGFPVTNPTTKSAPAGTVVNNLRPDQRYTTKTDISSSVTSNYHAMVIQVNHSLSHNLMFQGSYTWSHALDYGENNTTFTNSNSLLDPLNLRGEYGNSNQNVPSRAILTAVATSPWRERGWKSYAANDWELSPSFSAQAGEPYSATTNGSAATLVAPITSTTNSVTTTSNATATVTTQYNTGYVTGTSTGSFNGSGGANRIPLLNRNAFNLPSDVLVDLRGTKRFTIHESYRLELWAESFNLINRQNVTAANGTTYGLGTTTINGVVTNTLTANTTALGSITNSNNNNIYTPRQIQLGARFTF